MYDSNGTSDDKLNLLTDDTRDNIGCTNEILVRYNWVTWGKNNSRMKNIKSLCNYLRTVSVI